MAAVVPLAEQKVRLLAAQLRKSATEAGIVEGEPLAPVVAALADITETLGGGDVIRRAVAQGVSGHAGALAKALNVKNTLMIAGMLVAALLIGAGSGYWFRGEAPILAGVHAGSEKCEDRADGSRLCWLPIWERAPPTH